MAERRKGLVFRTHVTDTTRKFKVVHVIDLNNQLIGEIRWHTPWKQYCFFPFMHTVWSRDSLDVLMMKIDELMRERRRHG